MSDKNYLKNDGSDKVVIEKLIAGVLDNRWFIILTTLFFSSLGFLYAILATPIYKADALVHIEQKAPNSILSRINDILPGGKPQSASEIEIIKSRMIIGKIVQDLNLTVQQKKEYLPFVGKGIARLFRLSPGKISITYFSVPDNKLNSSFLLKFIANDQYVFNTGSIEINGKVGELLDEKGFKLLVSEIEAKPGSKFTLVKNDDVSAINNILLRLSVTDKSSDGGMLQVSLLGEDRYNISKILNEILKNYLNQNIARRSEEAEKILVFLKEQIPLLKDKLDRDEDKLNVFRQKNESFDLAMEAKSILGNMVSIDLKLNELELKESEISKSYTKEHPNYKALLEKKNTLQIERNKLDKKVTSMPKVQQELIKLTREAQSGQEMYMLLLNKQQELNINKASTVGNIRIIDPAASPIKPIFPKKAFCIVVSFFAGLILSFSIVLLRVALRKGIESPEQLEYVDIRVYASIPFSKFHYDMEKNSKKNNQLPSSLLSVNNPTDLTIESLRALRTNLHFDMLTAKNNILMISGVSPDIGKTFISTNLASVISLAGSRVLLIDCDMRRGCIHKFLNLDCKNVQNGLSEYLSNKINMQDTINKTSVEGFDFIPRGSLSENSSELLMSNKLLELLVWAESNYDIIVLDTPPISAVTDAAIIGHLAGTSLLVSAYEKNSVKDIEEDINRFMRNGVKINGVLINLVKKRISSKYGYSKYPIYEYH